MEAHRHRSLAVAALYGHTATTEVRPRALFFPRGKLQRAYCQCRQEAPPAASQTSPAVEAEHNIE
jgi:hypothetical protein